MPIQIHIYIDAVNLPLDISYEEISSNTERDQALPYITWGLVQDIQLRTIKKIPMFY